MFKTFFLILTFVALIYDTKSAVPFLKKICKSTDVKCHKEVGSDAIAAFVAGIPEYDVESMNPVLFKTLNASTNNLKLTLNDLSIYGMKSCNILNLERSPSNDRLFLKLECNNIKIDGKYMMNGKLLFLPIEGNDKVHATIGKIIISGDATMEDVIGKDGKTHWKITSVTHKYELKDKSDVEFENLFNGNEVLGGAVRTLIAENGNEIINEVGSPVIKAIVTKLVKNVGNFFKAVPKDELSLD